jgi:hypothetical protein
MTGERTVLMRRLLETVSHLSWPAGQQRSYLSGLVVAPLLDELALEFDDALKPVAARYDEFGVDGPSRTLLASIDAALEAMSAADESVWESAALDTDVRWAAIRGIAASCGSGWRPPWPPVAPDGGLSPRK